jgi:hypothetical protein
MHIRLFALALLCVATFAQGATHENSIDVLFPDEVGGLTYVGRKEFPQKELGVSLAYHGNIGGLIRGSVYIYNAGLSSIPAGVDSPVVRSHFTQVISDVKQMERGGAKVNLAGGTEQTTKYDGCGPQFIWRAYEMDLEGVDGTLASYTYLTALKNNFVKLRISHLKSDPQGRKNTEKFVQEIRKVLGRCK